MENLFIKLAVAGVEVVKEKKESEDSKQSEE
jgi:hypothetical protein